MITIHNDGTYTDPDEKPRSKAKQEQRAARIVLVGDERKLKPKLVSDPTIEIDAVFNDPNRLNTEVLNCFSMNFNPIESSDNIPSYSLKDLKAFGFNLEE